MLFNHAESALDQKLFDECFRKYYQLLCYFAFNHLKDKDMAEDIVQSVFLSLLNDKRSFDSEPHQKYFLYKSVRNACLNELKLRSIHQDILDQMKPDEAEVEEDPDLFQAMVRAEVYGEIMSAIESLPKECGKVFKMAYIQNYGNQEIAEMLSISINTVKVQKNKAKKRLRELLKDLYPLVFLFLKI